MQLSKVANTTANKGIFMSPEQKRQIEEARRESEEKTMDVCADGQKHKAEYDKYSNQVNNE